MSDAAIRAGLAALLHTDILSTPPQRIEGGCIHPCFRFQSANGAIFVKVAHGAALEIFLAEADGLKDLRAANAVRVPQVLGVGEYEGHALLALEWIDLHMPTPATDAKLGELLAMQHRVTKPLFGYKRGNFIGSTPQVNLWSRDWLNFWRERRFEAQLNLAESKGADVDFMERATLLSALMDGFFTGHTPIASLLHGDLWSGNCAVDVSGEPVIFDPAAYYGDRECDIAMTKLFGGFGSEFYVAYQNAWPLAVGWQQRAELYNLYHVLNHYNLFGGAYLAQANTIVGQLLAELGF